MGASMKRLCVEENSPIKMYDGSVKPIKDINKGDFVMSLGAKGRIRKGRVIHKYDHGIMPCIKITCLSPEASIYTLTAVGYHKVLTDKSWKCIYYLNPDDKMMRHKKKDLYVSQGWPLYVDFSPCEVVNIEKVGHKHVYDLTIDDFHNYIINDLFVHDATTKQYAKNEGDEE